MVVKVLSKLKLSRLTRTVKEMGPVFASIRLECVLAPTQAVTLPYVLSPAHL